MNRVKIKICGITSLEDALFAAQLGVDALGFVFYAESQRFIDSKEAGEIIRELPPFIKTVGLFVNADEIQVHHDLLQSGVELVQFHGDESDEFCRAFEFPYLKAVRVSPEVDIKAKAAEFPYASAILLDTYVPDEYGGTGKSFDWTRIPNDITQPIILAGGLSAENVGSAIERVAPYAVDVSGGVEMSKGKKDKQKMMEFVNAVKGQV